MDVSTTSESSATAVLEGLDVDHGKGRSRKGAPGSRENPEIFENVPGHVIPILEDEFDDFSSEAGGFLSGERAELDFIPFRLKQGVYGQRQPDVQMIRVKLPFGGVSPEQLEAFAAAIERWVPLRTAAATPAPRSSRTWSCAGSATRPSTTSGAGCASSASTAPAPSKSTT
jgi:hypothetical protein